MTQAKLLNISAGGGLVLSGGRLLPGRRLMMLIADVPELGWIDVRVVHSAGPGEVGVEFASPFRPEFIHAATSGDRRRWDDHSEGETPYLGDAIPIW